jgi:hypothetical protein
LYMRATVSAPFGVDDLVCTIATVCLTSTISLGEAFASRFELVEAVNWCGSPRSQMFAAPNVVIEFTPCAMVTHDLFTQVLSVESEVC